MQQRTFKRVGGTSDIRVDVRIVCATNRNLAEGVRLGRFREDLYYRLNVIEIALPPLRERRQDIPQLVQYFIERYSAQVGRKIEGIDPEAMALLERHRFPGNVRELENVIERAVTLCRGTRIGPDCLPANLLELSQHGIPVPAPSRGANLDDLLAEYERSLIADALEHASGVKKRAASLLGVSFRSLRYRLQRLAMEESSGNGGE